MTIQNINSSDNPNEGREKINANFQEISSNLQIISGATSGDGYTYAEVEVSSAELLSLGGFSPITIISAPGAGSYYEVKELIIESNFVTTPYTFSDTLNVRINGDGNALDDSVITFDEDYVTFVQTTNTRVGRTNSPIQLTVAGLGSPTLGDGTLLIKIRYKVRVFGSEL
jgi:hypothetical protein